MLALGQTVMTCGVSETYKGDMVAMAEIFVCLQRHKKGDWGNVDAEDQAENDRALQVGNRVVSVYAIRGKKIYIITEHDRSVTTVLFPDEY